MPTDEQESKSAVRSRIRAWLGGISDEERRVASEQACGLLKEQGVWRAAKRVLFYAALKDELDLTALWNDAIADGKQIALPRFVPQNKSYEVCLIDPKEALCQGQFGILEPPPGCSPCRLNQLDLTMVPGIAFDLEGRRLGRGRGFYDRLLKDVSGTKCGVAFDRQVEPQIPVEPHDIRVDCILTPTRWLTCG